jgi:hypothetical protein
VLRLRTTGEVRKYLADRVEEAGAQEEKLLA